MSRTEAPDRPLAVLLMGPTATGKTALAVTLARALPVEIISVDSAMVYRGLDVGTAKPSPALRAEIPHHLIDIADPAEPYSAARFRRDALDAMAGITQAGRIPLLAGGTMLYFRALQYGLSPLPGAHPEVRRRLEAEARASGWDVLHRRLATVDPAAARRIHPNDPQRIQRALEVYEVTGRPMTELYGRTVAEKLPYRLLKFAVEPPERSELHRRIADRFRGMLAAGLIDEVARLFERGDLRGSEPALRAVGYRQVWQYLAGEVSRSDMEFRAIKATRQLARRQMTWLRRESGLHWLPGGHTRAVRVVSGAVRDSRP